MMTMGKIDNIRKMTRVVKARDLKAGDIIYNFRFGRWMTVATVTLAQWDHWRNGHMRDPKGQTWLLGGFVVSKRSEEEIRVLEEKYKALI